MKKTILLLVVILSTSFVLKAQKKSHFVHKNIRYTHLPETPLPTTIKSYNVIFDFPRFERKANQVVNVMHHHFKIDYLENRGYNDKRYPADITLKFTCDNFTLTEHENEVPRPEQGLDVKEYTFYGFYTTTAWLIVINNKTETVIDSFAVRQPREKTRVDGLPFTSRSDAREDFKDKHRNMRDELTQALWVKVDDYLLQYYDTKKVHKGLYVGYIKNKKGKYDDMQKASHLISDAIHDGSRDYLISPANSKVQLKLAIKLLTEAESTYSSKKKSRINYQNIKYIYHNLALAYTLLNDVEKANSYVRKTKGSRGQTYEMTNTINWIESELGSISYWLKKNAGGH